MEQFHQDLLSDFMLAFVEGSTFTQDVLRTRVGFELEQGFMSLEFVKDFIPYLGAE